MKLSCSCEKRDNPISVHNSFMQCRHHMEPAILTSSYIQLTKAIVQKNIHAIDYYETTYTNEHKFKQVNHVIGTYFQKIGTKLST